MQVEAVHKAIIKTSREGLTGSTTPRFPKSNFDFLDDILSLQPTTYKVKTAILFKQASTA